MPKITKRRLEILLEKLRDGVSICSQGRNNDHCVHCPINEAMIEAEAITEVLLTKTDMAVGLKSVSHSKRLKNHGQAKLKRLESN